MSWIQVQDIETTDYEPPRATRVKKMIWDDTDRTFHTHYFIRVRCQTSAEVAATVEWLQADFGEPRYQGSWWREPSNPSMLWLSDHLATFWQLKYGDRR